jgi:hypothetical protein
MQLPNGMSRGEVLLMLRQRRLTLTKRLAQVKQMQTDLNSERERIERDLRDIESSENLLSD